MAKKKNTGGTYQCKYCPKNFKNPGWLKLHTDSAHSTESPQNAETSPLQIDEANPAVSPLSETRESDESTNPFNVSGFNETSTQTSSNSIEDQSQSYNEGTLFQEKSVEAILDVIFDRVADLRGDFWKLTKTEKEAIIPPLTKILNKHLGGKVGKYSDEIALCLSIGIVFIGKYMMDRKVNNRPFVKTESQETVQTPPDTVDNVPEIKKSATPTTNQLLDMYPGLDPNKKRGVER